jgi:hypothetical protein
MIFGSTVISNGTTPVFIFPVQEIGTFNRNQVIFHGMNNVYIQKRARGPVIYYRIDLKRFFEFLKFSVKLGGKKIFVHVIAQVASPTADNA